METSANARSPHSEGKTHEITGQSEGRKCILKMREITGGVNTGGRETASVDNKTGFWRKVAKEIQLLALGQGGKRGRVRVDDGVRHCIIFKAPDRPLANADENMLISPLFRLR